MTGVVIRFCEERIPRDHVLPLFGGADEKGSAQLQMLFRCGLQRVLKLGAASSVAIKDEIAALEQRSAVRKIQPREQVLQSAMAT